MGNAPPATEGDFELIDWAQKIGLVRSQLELLELSREYLASWFHGDLALIPEECRPTRIRDTDDLHYWSERLAESFCAGALHGEKPDLHRQMLAFFMTAAARSEALPRQIVPLSPARTLSRG
jgi:hypothetical protein